MNKRKLVINDLERFTMINDPQISPKGDTVAFVISRLNLRKDNYRNNIWLLDIENRVITPYITEDSYWPRWSKDGDKILYITRRKSENGYILWISFLNKRREYRVLERDEEITQAKWCDDRKISFISPVREKEEDVYFIKRIPLWFDGKGYIYNMRYHLFTVEYESGIVNQLTEGEINVNYASPSHRGDKIALLISADDLNPLLIDIYIYDLKRENMERITQQKTYIELVDWSPDDKYLYFRGHDLQRGFATHENIWMLNIQTSELINLTKELNRNTSRRIYYDLRGPYGFSINIKPIWIDKYIYFPVSDSGKYNLYRINIENNGVEGVLTGNFVIEGFDINKNVIIYTKTSSIYPSELWIYRGDKEEKLTRFNEEIMESLEISPPKKIQYTASDGITIEGWIIDPAERINGEKYPMIINIHGGPKSEFGYTFMFEHQLLASNGYTVIYLNPRGSDGYTEDFADIRLKYGTRDFKDIMEGIDYIISKYNYIDPDRLGVTGISYGGFMTNWIITHSDRFKAAVSQNGISDWISMFTTTDIGFYFCPDQIGKDLWKNLDEYLKRSPLIYASNVKTPILFIHTLDDYRCWFDQAIELYTALKYLGKKTELALFKEGGHVFGWLGRPSLRIKRIETMIKWFDKYLKS